MKKIKKYIIPTVCIVMVALIGSLFTYSGMDWYETLVKPKEWVMSFVIPIMWTIIYSLFWLYMITSNYYLYPKIKNLLVINGFLNIFWCFIYFVINSLLGGIIVIILNLITSILLIVEISKIYKIWVYLLMIYPIWLCIATVLNIAVFILN